MMLEISALQAQVAHLEEEKRNLEEQLSLKFKERYDPLVRHLFSTCIHLKVRNLILYFWRSLNQLTLTLEEWAQLTDF